MYVTILQPAEKTMKNSNNFKFSNKHYIHYVSLLQNYDCITLTVQIFEMTHFCVGFNFAISVLKLFYFTRIFFRGFSIMELFFSNDPIF